MVAVLHSWSLRRSGGLLWSR